MAATLPFSLPPTVSQRLWFQDGNVVLLSSFFLEDEEDEEMVEPKIGQDSELENQDKKQEVKEGKVGSYTRQLFWVFVVFYTLKDDRSKSSLSSHPLCIGLCLTLNTFTNIHWNLQGKN